MSAPLPPGPARNSLVDVVDRLFDRGVVVRGELWLTVADVELVFVGADLLIASADRIRAERHGARGTAPEAGR